MGWKGKLVGKVGHYLSQSIEFPIKQLYKYAGPPPAMDTQTTGQPHQNLSDANSDMDSDEEYEYGPDTSSLTAFLYSLLSSNSNGSQRYNDSPEASTDGIPRNSNVIFSTSGSWQHHDINEEQHTSLDRSLSTDSGKVMLQCKSFSKNQSVATSQPSSPMTPVKLPPLSEKSVLLSEGLRAFIYKALPNIVKDRHWVMLYSTSKHGISLRTLYRKSAEMAEPFLLVAGDFHGAIFGGLLTSPLKPTSKRKYLGTNDMFVFTNVHEKPQIFRATGANRYFLLCMNDAISLGGGGHFALHLDEDLLNGSSGACDTFGNQCLATTPEFSVANVELWGFAHASRYG